MISSWDLGIRREHSKLQGLRGGEQLLLLLLLLRPLLKCLLGLRLLDTLRGTLRGGLGDFE